MRVLLALLLLSVTSKGLATALGSRVQSLVGKKLTSSVATVAKKFNEVDEDGRNALHHAVILGNLPLVEFFLANGIDTKATDNNDLIPLHYATRLASEQPSIERMKIASIVLEETRGILNGDEQGWRPMGWSLLAGDYDRVAELRDRGAGIFDGRFPAPRNGQLAGRHNAVWLAEQLQDDRAIKILAEGVPDKYFPMVVNNGYRKFTQAMIEQGVDINTRDDNEYTAAMRAAKAGRFNDLQMLIDNGAQIDSDVLRLAIRSGNPNLVKMLLAYNVDLARELVTDHTIHGTIDDLLANNSTSKGGRRIIRMLEKATVDMPFIPATSIAKLSRLKAEKYSPQDSLLAVATHQGLEQEIRELLNYLVSNSTTIFLPTIITNRVFMKEPLADHNLYWNDGRFYLRDRMKNVPSDGSSMLLNNLVEVMNNWQPTTKDRLPLLHTLRIAITEKHKPLIEAVLDSLNNDSNFVYRELLRGLAIANKTNNDSLAELLLERAVIAGINKDTLINHAKPLSGLSIHNLTNTDDLYGLALLLAFEQDDLTTIQQLLINHNLKIDDHLMGFVVYRTARSKHIQLLEFLIDHQIISLDYGDGYQSSILLQAASAHNFPTINKIVSLGGRLGLNESLRRLVYQTHPDSKSDLAEFEEKMLATMRLLIEAGADVNALGRNGESPLTQAIKSLQTPRVELLLEYGAVTGDLDDALRHAAYYYPRGLLQHEKKFHEIEQLLTDRGLRKL